jgi:cytidyltransferase-like protein
MTRRVLIFGTFDGYDAGHQFVVSEASKKGTELIVAVARDAHVQHLKQKDPKWNEIERMNRVKQDPLVTSVVLSDQNLGSYQILDEQKPDVIVLGFDQSALKSDLVRWMHEQNRNIPIEILEYLPE